MRIKRFFALLLAAAAALALTGCGAGENKDESAAMTIQPAQLSGEETALTELLGLEMKSYNIFDFEVSGAQSVRIAAYELSGSEWKSVSTGLGTFAPEGAGRICLAFGKMDESVSVRYQNENGGGGVKFAMPGGGEAGLVYASSTLTSGVAVELDQEIPLAVQIATSQNEIVSYDVNYFGMPREYAKHGYEHVYAITVTFSGEPVSGISQDAPSDSASAEPLPAD